MTTKNFYSTKEKLFLGLLFLAALASLFFFLNFRTLAFPEHNIDFHITREQAAEKSRSFVKGLGYEPQEYKETTVFVIDNAPKTYLEREVGVSETAELAADEVDIWHFVTRFFKPLEKEEISVTYMPNGRLTGYYREIEEAAPGARLQSDQAKKLAEKFLKDTIKADLGKWQFVDSERVEQPKRVDYTFTWEKKDFTSGDATYRMDVHVYGDTIGGYVEQLKIPEAWMRDYTTETSNNDLAQTIAEALMVLLFGLPILITFVLQYKHNNLRISSFKSIAIATFVIVLLTVLNSIPITLASYDTTMSWEAFLGSVVILSLLGAVFEAASIMLIIVAGDAKFREVYPGKLSLEASMRRALRTKEINKALFIGVFVGIIIFSYELLYYFWGKQIGFWAPADTNYTDIFSTYLPWIYPLFVGFIAAAAEEGMFRLFGIPFLKKYLKSTWAAILITSVVWAFLHSNYPQSPWFVRGIEVSIMGIVLGTLFVRYGFWASFSAHFTFNSLQTAIYFFASGSLYASISSTAVSLLPLIIAVVLLVISVGKKGFVQIHKEDLNSGLVTATEPVITEPKEHKKTMYAQLTNAGKQYLIALSMLSLFLIWLLYPKTSLEQAPRSVGRQEIIKTAEETLKHRGVRTEDYLQVAEFRPEDISYEEEYILEKEDFSALREIYPEKLPLAHWIVRYFKPLQKDEYIVDITPDGKVYEVISVIDEKAPGADLTTEQAQKIVQEYLAEEKSYKLEKYTLIENKVEKRENRTDHILVYEEKGTMIGEATFRTEVVVKGENISGYNQFLKLPEAWLREKTETTTIDFVVGSIIILFGLMLLWFGFRTFFALVQAKELKFRLGLTISAVVAGFSLVATLNSLSLFYSGYDTAVPLASYIFQSVLSLIMGLVFTLFAFALVFATFIALWRQFNGYVLPADTKIRAIYIKDALIAGYSVPIIIMGVSTLMLSLLIEQDLLNSVATFDLFPKLDTFFPAIATITGLAQSAGGACLIAINVLLLRKYFKSWKRVLISLSCIAILLAIPQQRTTEAIAISIVQNLLLLFGCVLVTALILKRNLFAYALMLYNSLLLGSGWVLINQQELFYKVNGIILFLFALLPIMIYLFSTRVHFLRNKRGSGLSPSSSNPPI